MVLTDPNSWEDCGFPNINFRMGYLPWVGLAKAVNERLAAAEKWGIRQTVPGYFTRRSVDMIYYCIDFDRFALPHTVYAADRPFINPDKIPSATNWEDCKWTYSDLLLAAAGGVEADIVTADNRHDMLLPEFPVKWALQRYNAINLLRYSMTTYHPKWPYVEYKDINDTYNFKAPEP